MKTVLLLLGAAILVLSLFFVQLVLEVKLAVSGFQAWLSVTPSVLGFIRKRFEFLIVFGAGGIETFIIGKNGARPLAKKKKPRRHFGLPKVLRLLGHSRLRKLSVDAELGISENAALTAFLSGSLQAAIRSFEPLVSLLFEPPRRRRSSPNGMPGGAASPLSASVRPVFGRDGFSLELTGAASTSLMEQISK